MLREFLLQRGLSNREVEVAELVSKGMANKEVADKLFVTEKTVKFHLTNIYKKMEIKSRSQLIVWCLPHLRMQEEEAATVQTQNPIINTQRTVNQGIDLISGRSQGLPSGSADTFSIEQLPNGLKK
ncbi:MAG: response regulator transcription factor [Bdellovibrionales bacterium]